MPYITTACALVTFVAVPAVPTTSRVTNDTAEINPGASSHLSTFAGTSISTVTGTNTSGSLQVLQSPPVK